MMLINIWIGHNMNTGCLVWELVIRKTYSTQIPFLLILEYSALIRIFLPPIGRAVPPSSWKTRPLSNLPNLGFSHRAWAMDIGHTSNTFFLPQREISSHWHHLDSRSNTNGDCSVHIPEMTGKAHTWFLWRTVLHFYRTQVSLGSGLWVPASLTTSKTFVKLCWCDSGWWWYQLNTNDGANVKQFLAICTKCHICKFH